MNLIKLESLRVWVGLAFVTNIVAMPSWAATISMRQGTAIVEIKDITTVPSNPQTEDLVTVIAHITNEGTWAINGQCQFKVNFGGQVIKIFSDQSWANPAPGNPASPTFRFSPKVPGVYVLLVTWKPTERYNSDAQESRSIQVTVSGPDTSKTNPNPFWKKEETHAEAEHVREMQGLSKEEYEKRYRAEQKTADTPGTMLHDRMHGLQKDAQKSQTLPPAIDDRAAKDRQAQTRMEQAQRAQAERDKQEQIRKEQAEQEKAAMLRRQQEDAEKERLAALKNEQEQMRKTQAKQQEAERRRQDMEQAKKAEEERQRREVYERAQKEKEERDRQWQAKLQREEAERQQRLEEGRKMNERIRLENEQREQERQRANEERQRERAEMARRQQEAMARQQRQEEIQRQQALAQAAQQDAMRRSQGAAAAGMLLGMMAQGAQEREAREQMEREQAARVQQAASEEMERERRNRAARGVETLTFRIVSEHPNVVHVQIYSLDRNHVWPSADRVFVVKDNNVNEMTIEALPGEKVQFGAWVAGNPDAGWWGVGKDNKRKDGYYEVGKGEQTNIIKLKN